MTAWLIRRFVKDYENTENGEVRAAYGTLGSCTGILVNLLLSAGKFLIGLLSGSVAILADAANNLSDAAGSIVALVSTRVARKPVDAEHPFGHGRIEYLAGLIVSLAILVGGVELGRSSIDKILHPEDTHLTGLTAAILVASILVKLWMGWFNGALSRRIRSEALKAAAADSRSDAVATAAVLLGLVLSALLRVPLDGWVGVLVALFVVKTGFSSARDTLNPLLGQPPDPEEVRAIEELILSFPPIRGIHDLVIHDYGPGRRMLSVHAEVPAGCDIMEVHDVIDHAERELKRRFGMEAVIHMDPVQTDDPKVERLLHLTEALAGEIDPAITVHDFRITDGPKFTNLIFDLVLPYDVPLTADQVKERLAASLAAADPRYRAVIDVDRSYVR